MKENQLKINFEQIFIFFIFHFRQHKNLYVKKF